MNLETSFVKVLGIKTIDNELIPIWDNRLKYVEVNDENDHSYSHISLDDDYERFIDLITLMYDVSTKKLSEGIILDFYPPDSYYGSSIKHAIGDIVYYEVESLSKGLLEVQVIDTVYEKYKDLIRLAENIESYYISHFKDVVFNCNSVYCIRIWDITYILSNGVKKTRYELYKKYKG
jgi:hypothetical protein